jgi:hypothetical protein
MKDEKKLSFMIILFSGISTNVSVFWIEQLSNWDELSRKDMNINLTICKCTENEHRRELTE